MYLNFLVTDACKNISVLKICYFIKLLLKYIFILVPIVLILVISLDFARNVVSSKEGDMQNNLKMAIKRILYCVVLFLVPSVVKFFISSNFVESNFEYSDCLNVTISAIDKQTKKNKLECENLGSSYQWDSDANECLLKDTPPNKDISYSNGGIVLHNSSTEEEEKEDVTNTLSGKNNKDKIWNYLLKAGFTEEQAAGIMGNIQQESYFDTKATNKRSGAYGLCQWLGDRKKRLKSFADKNNKSMSNLNVQLDFMMAELNGREKKAKSHLNKVKQRNENGVKKAAYVWDKYYERSGGGSIVSRKKNALKIYRHYIKKQNNA